MFELFVIEARDNKQIPCFVPAASAQDLRQLTIGRQIGCQNMR